MMKVTAELTKASMDASAGSESKSALVPPILR